MSVLTSGAVVTSAAGGLMAAASAFGLGFLAALAFRQLRGTTLAAPALWTIVSALSIAATELAAIQGDGGSDPLAASLWRYAAAVSTFCPLMAVLGAKRPQDRGWQWVVLSLWGILLAPAMQAVAARSGQHLELFGPWRMLIWALLAMGLLNYLPTRFAISAMAAALGQTLLLAPYLVEGTTLHQWRPLGAVGLLASAVLAKGAARRRQGEAASHERRDSLQPSNDRWKQFRDGWGAFWGLRILQRINQTSELSRWPVRLEWTRGFVSITAEGVAADTAPLEPQTVVHIEQTLDSLLRRFERLDRA